MTTKLRAVTNLDFYRQLSDGNFDFQNCELVEVDFSGQILGNLLFQGTKFTRVNFHHAVFDLTDFSGVHIVDSDMTDALFLRSNTFHEAKITRCIVDYAVFIELTLSHVYIIDTDISNVRMIYSDLANSYCDEKTILPEGQELDITIQEGLE
jgi:uncharacterized protein YjbI with pentapeptide repeats